ncbi:MAG: nucleotide sugar dehydrogenase [Chlamydiales bacterium]
MRLSGKIASQEAVIGVIGLGYIGLQLLDVFGRRGFRLVGYDCDRAKIASLKRGHSMMNFLPLPELFRLQEEGRFRVAANPDILHAADVLFICVPTSLDRHMVPNFSSLRSAFQTVADHLHRDQLVVLQSTTYPGTTEEELLPILEKKGEVGKDYYLAYVPEISDPGNLEYDFTSIPRIVSGVTPQCLEMVKMLYQKIGCQEFPCRSPRVAEAAKIFTNAYRLINISFVNEMKMMFDHMGMDVWEVIEAASSKPFGFTAFYPGPGAGGDCIPVDPNYLVWKAKESAGPVSMIELASNINQVIPHYVVDKVIQGLAKHKQAIQGAQILLLGVGFKKDVNGLQESASLKLLSLLQKEGAAVSYHDPYIAELYPSERYPQMDMKSASLEYEKLGNYDAVVIATDHSIYDVEKIVQYSTVVIDTRNVTAKVAGAEKKVVKA